jgi:uncharacterized protein YeaO (DUF488 family)
MIRVLRIGDPRGRGEGVRLGTVRLLPRGVRKEEYSKRNLFDVWVPQVSPTSALVAYAQAKPWTDARWAAFRKRYLREMQRPEAQRAIELLAALGKQTNFSICCYCENPYRCHRSVLGELLRERGTEVKVPLKRDTTPPSTTLRSASPRRSR